MKRHKILVAVTVLSLLLQVLAGCAPQATPTPTPKPKPTSPPPPTAPPAALGTSENPIVLSMVPSGDTEEILQGGEEITALLAEKTGLVIDVNVATSYAAVIEAMGSGKAHMATLATFSYLLAHEKYGVDVGLVSARYGTPYYKGQIIANADSGIQTIADIKGKTMCWVDATSTSGYIVPLVSLKAAGVDPDAGDLAQQVEAGSHNNVVLAVYRGECDAGATYVDARGNVAAEYPDVNEKVIVIAESAEIPNDGLQFIADFPSDLRAKIVQAFIEIMGTEVGVEAMTKAYAWSEVIEKDDSFYDGFRATLDAAGVDIAELENPPPIPVTELGSAGKPIVLSMVPSGDTEEILVGGEEIIALLAEKTGYNFEVNVATSYTAVIEAMGSKKAHMATLATFSYLLANEKYGVDVALVSARYGTPYYKGQIIARADSGIETLADLKGKTMCWVDATSTSGYIVPKVSLKAAGVDPDAGDLAQQVEAGSHNNVVLAVYRGECDAGATYVDARGNVAAEYPDVNDKVIVIAESAEIPNDGLQFIADFPAEKRAKIVAAFIEIMGTEEGVEAMSKAYQWSEVIEKDDTFYDGFRATLNAAGVDIAELSAPPPMADVLGDVDPTGQEVLFWHVSTQIHEEVLLELIDEFNSTNEWGITVLPEYGGYYGDLMEKNLAAIAAGTPPDLSIGYANQVAAYAEADAVEPLDDYLYSAKWGLTAEDLADIYPAFLETDRNPDFGDKLLSFPPSRSMEVMFYNIDWLSDLGYDAPPETWGEFKEMCMAATDTAAGTSGYALAVSASTFASWVWSRGGELLNADATEAIFNGPEGVEALTFLQELIEGGYAYQIAESYGDQTDFANEIALFAFGSTAGLPYYAAAVEDEETGEPKFNWSVAPPPHSTADPVVDIYGPSICVFRSTPEKQLASWLFMRWFTEAEPNVKWAKVANYFPIRASAVESAEMQAYMAENPNYTKSFGFLPWGKGEPVVPAYQTMRGFIGDAITAVVTGMSTPQEALDYAVEESNAVLAE